MPAVPPEAPSAADPGASVASGAGSAPLRLTGRSSSHFTRVARMLALELGVPLELHVLADVASMDPADYEGNPALKIPALRHDGGVLFGTENICRKLAELAGRADDPRVVLPHHVADDLTRSAQELVWHAMSAEVLLVMGVQVSRLPPDAVLLAKARAGLHGAFAWLDARLDAVLARLPSPRDVSVLEVALFCVLEHVAFRSTVPLEPYPRLRAFAAAYAERDSARRTPFRFDAPPAPAPEDAR